MAVKNNDINIQIFDGVDYSNWKLRLFKFLQYKKCRDVVMRAIISTDDDGWNERDIRQLTIFTAQ